MPLVGRAVLTIHDIQERKLMSPIDAEQSAGAHVLSWSDRDSQGARVRSGVFFVRPVTHGRLVTRKFVRKQVISPRSGATCVMALNR